MKPLPEVLSSLKSIIILLVRDHYASLDVSIPFFTGELVVEAVTLCYNQTK